MSVCQMVSTYHAYDGLLRKLAERYQAPLGNHNILIYPEWQAFLSLTFVQGILHNGRAVYLSPPQPKGASFAPARHAPKAQEPVAGPGGMLSRKTLKNRVFSLKKKIGIVTKYNRKIARLLSKNCPHQNSYF